MISGKHTKSGKPILSDDTHLNNGVPSLWHLSRVIYPDGSYVFGFSVPGSPMHAVLQLVK